MVIDYKEFYQGRTINVFEEHDDSLCYTLRSAAHIGCGFSFIGLLLTLKCIPLT